MDRMANKRYDVMKREQWEYQIPGYKKTYGQKRLEIKKTEEFKISLRVVSRNRINIRNGISRDPAFRDLGNPRNSVAHLVGHAVKRLWKHGRSPISRKVPREG
jgi:hypothetical protein